MHERGLTTAWLSGQLVIEGECDIDTAPLMLAAIEAHTEGADTIRCQVERLNFCDSACLSVFMAVIRRGKRVILVRPSPILRRTLQVINAADIEGLEVED